MKRIYFFTLITVFFYFSSCAYIVNKNYPDSYKETINVMQIEYDDTSNLVEVSLSINNGSKEIDPNELSFIDIKFSKKMNTSYGGYVYYGDIKDDLDTCYWLDSYTYRIFVNLKYDTYYKIVLNDVNYGDEDPDWKKNYFFRDTDGNYVREFVLEFSTISKTVEDEKEETTLEIPTATLSIENGSTNIDPSVLFYIDVTFSNSMNTNYGGYIYYGDIKDDLGTSGWVDSYTYRIYFNLKYGKEYKIVLNDEDYAKNQPDWKDKNKGFFRDTNGNYIEQFIIEFATISKNVEDEEEDYAVRSDSITATLTSGKDCHIYYFETSSSEAEYKITITDYDGLTSVNISDDYAFYNILSSYSGYSFESNKKKKIYIKLYSYNYRDYNSGQYKLEVSGKAKKKIILKEYEGTIDSSIIKTDAVTATLASGKDCHIYYFETSASEAEYKITITDYDGLTSVNISDDYAFYNILSSYSGYSFESNKKKRIYIKLYPYNYRDYNAGQYKLQVSGKTDEEIKLYNYQN